MDLAERLLGPQFEAALEEHRFVKDPLLRAYAKAIRELHARLATAKLEGAAEELEKYSKEVDEETRDEDSFFHGATTTEGLRERAAAIRKQMEGK